jgi:hypothetical protein
MNQTLHYHIDNSAYRFEINNIQYSLVILVQWRSIVKRRDLMGLEASVRARTLVGLTNFYSPIRVPTDRFVNL